MDMSDEVGPVAAFIFGRNRQSKSVEILQSAPVLDIQRNIILKELIGQNIQFKQERTT